MMVDLNPLIEIVIPNWNGKELLVHCLLSLRSQTYTGFRVIVVDNGSTDGSVALLEEKFPEVKVVRLGTNTGFAYAVNKGIENSRAPWLLLLNNDMEVAPACLESLSQAIEKYQQFDFFALKMMNFNDRKYLDGAGDAVLRGGVGYRIGTMEMDCARYQVDRETFGACAGAALYSKRFFSVVGHFDPCFFAYLEDVDLNLRARRLGLRCMFIASAIVYHIGSATTGSKINKLTVRLSTRNNLFVLFKNYSLRLFFRSLHAIVLYQLAWACFCIKKGMVSAYLKGIFEALLCLPDYYKMSKRHVAANTRISSDCFAGLLKQAERDAINSIMARRIAAGKSTWLFSWYCRFFL